MAPRINATGVNSFLQERLSSNAEIVKSAGELFAFYAVASSGEHLALAAGIALIGKAAAAAIKGSSELLKRLCSDAAADEEDDPPAYERFRIIFYALCLESYLSALESKIAKLAPLKAEKKHIKGDEGSSDQDLLQSLNLSLTTVQESEVPFLLGVDPLAGEVPLYQALTGWVTLLLSRYGFPEYQTRPILNEITTDAKQRFHVYIASETREAKWIKTYLLLNAQPTNKIASDLASVSEALQHWIRESIPPKERQLNAWIAYRRLLKSLPDSKDSMYNEDFGVRDVFVRPQGTYTMTGGTGETGKAQLVSDLGLVLGGLLSTRVSGDDLILLCGGPGSGKSTLCRILASQLAADSDVYPIFVRLRRLKEGSDIPAFLESELSRIGLVDRISDLRELKNVVLILDGFDELVMASRSRLRHFFNALREDHMHGALSSMRIIVSGRDTLFPGGEGLPLGCHVLTLRPFDRPRVALWGRKWRARHKGGGGSTFRPETLLPKDPTGTSALQHLVSWPLTLHLVARVHTSGRMQVVKEESSNITKAILYRSILMETSSRQRDQTDGKGRLEPKAMREFLRALAWRMYEDGRDSMDPSEVLPILKTFFPDRTETDLAELAEVAVVNSPEITKGEQTGFEFVHKSFAEYLTAERIAIEIERVTFEAAEFDSPILTWRMSEADAASTMAAFLSIRLLTEEIQEMLEPMLGDFKGFSDAAGTNDSNRQLGLAKVIRRFESLLESFLRGALTGPFRNKVHPFKPQYEIQANFSAGLLLIGGAAARQQDGILRMKQNYFILQKFEGAFWRLLSILQAGGVLVNEHVANRLFSGCGLSNLEKAITDLDVPIKPAWLASIPGFETPLSDSHLDQQSYMAEMAVTLEISVVIISALLPDEEHGGAVQRDLMRLLETVRHEAFSGYRWNTNFPTLGTLLVDAGYVKDGEPDFFFYRHTLLRPVGHPADSKDLMNNLSYALERISHGSRRRRGLGGYARFLQSLLKGLQEAEGPSKASTRLIERMRAVINNFT